MSSHLAAAGPMVAAPEGSCDIWQRYALAATPVYEAPASRVYLGEERSSGTRVAVKVVNKPGWGNGNEDDCRQLLTELSTYEEMPPHPNILHLLGVEETASAWLLAMPYASGGDLWGIMKYGRTFCEREVRNCMGQVLAALEHLHEACCLMHNDLKPQNLLLISNGGRYTVQLSDFGLSRRLSAPDACVEFAGLQGTEGWLSPEELEGKPYGAAVDLFACGLIVFRMLAGYAPFEPHSEAQSVPASFDERYWGHVSEPCRLLAAQLLSTAPSARGTARVARQQAWLAGSPPPEPTPEQLARLASFGPLPDKSVLFWPPSDQPIGEVTQPLDPGRRKGSPDADWSPIQVQAQGG